MSVRLFHPILTAQWTAYTGVWARYLTRAWWHAIVGVPLVILACAIRGNPMSFWQWFQTNGAKLFAFVAAVALALQGMSWMSANADHAMEVAGVLATIAHQIFFPGTPSFPNSAGPTGPKA